jgi:HD superfamily phosphohydrolase
MSDQTKKRRREATIEAPSLEEIGVPFARRQRLDGGSEGRSVISVENWSTGQVAERLRDRGVGDDILQLFRENKIAGRHLAGLSKGDLTDMGIGAVGTQKDVLETVKTILSQCRKKELEKVFNDPVHGHIELHPLMVRFMDTPQFQRLRYIKQLGGGYYVFPGASHNRFEHSIGVGYLAGELAETLQRKQRELDITDADVLCVKLAGLCHDLGHGPFSHLFDGKFIPKVLPERKWKHEVASVMMLDHLIEENGLMEEMMRYGLDENDVTFIKELIIGAGKNANETPTTPPRHDWEYKGRPESKSFLYEIVANKRTEVDVDKWDYFARDCHHLGIPNSFDLGRYMTFVRVNEVDTTYEGQVVHRRRQICTRDKEATNLYEMFHTRSMLHRRAYQHKTSNIIEEMVTEALVAANDHLLIPGKDGKKVKMSEAIEDPVAFTRLTDQVLQQIQLSTDPNLQKAKDILAKVETRRLYKHVGQTQALTPLDKVSYKYQTLICYLCFDLCL